MLSSLLNTHMVNVIYAWDLWYMLTYGWISEPTASTNKDMYVKGQASLSNAYDLCVRLIMYVKVWMN